MSDPKNSPQLCIKQRMLTGAYACGVCGAKNLAAGGFDVFLNGKVYIEGTDTPVCDVCCAKYAPYLHSLCRLEEVVDKSFGYNCDPAGNEAALDAIQKIGETHAEIQKEAGKKDGYLSPSQAERLLKGVDLGSFTEEEEEEEF